MFRELSWLLAFDVFNDCVLFALMRTNDVSKNRLSKCGSNVVFVANRLLSGVRFDEYEQGKLIVAAFDLAVKFLRFSASGRNKTLESMRVTMNLRRVPVLTSVSFVVSSLVVSLVLLPFVKLLLAKSPLRISSLSSSSLSLRFRGEFDRISLALLFIRTVFRKSPPALAASISVDTLYNRSDDVGDTLLVVVFSSISGSRLNLANLLVVNAVALAGGGIEIVFMVSILSRSSIDAANSFSNSSCSILSFKWPLFSSFFL